MGQRTTVPLRPLYIFLLSLITPATETAVRPERSATSTRMLSLHTHSSTRILPQAVASVLSVSPWATLSYSMPTPTFIPHRTA